MPGRRTRRALVVAGVALLTANAAHPRIALAANRFALDDLAFAACSTSTQVRAADRAPRGVAAAPGSPQTSPPPAQPETGPQTGTATSGGVVNRTVIGGAALQETSQQGTFDAIKSVPGVEDTQTRASSGADSLQIRGIKLDNSSNYRLDGALVLNNQINLPLEDKCKIEALKGAGALEFGIASPAGIVNYILKRATVTPTMAVGFSANGYGQAIESLDLGERFGSRDQFGARLTLAGGQAGSVARGAGGTRYVGAFTGDWYLGDRATVQFGFEQLGINLIEQSALLLDKPVKGVIALPDPTRIDPRNLLSGDWAWSRGWEQNIVGRFGYALSPNTQFVFQSGRSEADRPQRIVTQIGTYNVATGAGTENVTFVQGQDYINSFYGVAFRARVDHPWLANEVTVGIDVNHRSFNNPQNPTGKLAQNIYSPVALAAPRGNVVGRSVLPNIAHDSDPYISDTLTLFNRLKILGGLRQINYFSGDQLAKGGEAVDRNYTLAPAAAIIFDVRPNISAYASFVASLQQTGQAPAIAANAYQVLPPERATQKEIGVRATDLRGISPTVDYFRISEGNATTDPVTNIYNINGTITYEGLESTVQFAVNRRLSLTAGGIFVRAEQIADDPTINGLAPENLPHLNYNLGVSWQTPFARGLTVGASRRYASWKDANPQDQATLPGVSLLALDANYATRIGGKRVTLSATATNLLEKRYLSSALNGNLGVGTPRTVTFNARFAL